MADAPLTQYDVLRLSELRSMEHRELARHALEVEERLRRWRDLTMTVKFAAVAAAFLAGMAVEWIAAHLAASACVP